MKQIETMIEFSDLTVREGHGNFGLIKELMGHGSWMLRTQATVCAPKVTSDYLIHLWDTGTAVIKATSRPMNVQIPDDDVRGLSEYLKNHGWEHVEVDHLLLEEPQGFAFWLRMYQTGIVESNVLKQHDENEMKRMQAAFEAEEEYNAN